MLHLDHIINVLLKNDILDKDLLEKRLAEANAKEISFEEYLVQNKIISEEILYQLLANEYEIPFIDLSSKDINERTLQMIPETIAQAHQIIAFEATDTTISVALLDPDNIEILDVIQKKTGRETKAHLTTHKSIREALKLYHKDLQLEFARDVAAEKGKAVPKSWKTQKPLEQLAEDLPVIRIVDSLLDSAISQNASDIHIEPSEEDMTVRFRIDGILHRVMTLPRSVEAGIVARIKVLANLKIDEHRLPQDGRFKLQKDNVRMAFRVSIIPVFVGEKVVMRLLDESQQTLTFEQLGLEGKALEAVHRNIRKPHGIVLVTGPTGSGKTTTLYAVLTRLNTPEVNISTIEDPIEYHIKGINQSQVNPKIGFTFASGLRAFLRQDPNIIMVGEIRDAETANIAAQAALTGHLVLSTLHTNDAVTTLPRLREMGVEPFLIASTMNLVIAQRLVRKICEKCIESYTPEPKAMKGYEELLGIPSLPDLIHGEESQEAGKQTKEKEILFFRGKGCKECGNDGYSGRMGIFEVLEVTKEISEAIVNTASTEELRTLATKQDMRSIVQDGIEKVTKGITTIEEILRVTQE